VSPEGDSRVYLVANALSGITAEPIAWVDAQIVSVPSADIDAVEIRHPEGETVTLARNGGELTIPGLADDEEFDASKRWGVSGALSFLRFTQLADPSLDDAVTGMDQPVVYRATTRKRLVYEVHLGTSPEGSEERFARFSVSAPPLEQMDAIPEDEDSEVKAAMDERVREQASLLNQVDELNARLRGWTFRISPSHAEHLMFRRDDLVKAKAAPQAEETDSVGDSADSGEPSGASSDSPQ